MKLKAIFNIVMFVCCCLGVTDRTILATIGRGARTVEEITACTGAGSKCGTCRAEIAQMIAASNIAAGCEGPLRKGAPTDDVVAIEPAA